ncbi:MAG: sigma 54-interacting transcriptional regulator [Planctomycetia bacterium]
MSAPAPLPLPCLLLQEPGGERVVALGPGPLVVGRGSGCGLRLDDPSLSARHLALEPVAGGGWKAVDLDSKNGTFVNDQLVQQRLLEDGDRLRAGRVQAVVRLEAGPGELLAELEGWVQRAGRRLGRAGLEQGLGRLAQALGHGAAGAPGAPGPSGGLEAVRSLQALLPALLGEVRPEVLAEQVLDALVRLTGAERGFFLLEPGALGEASVPGAAAGEEPAPRVLAARNLDGEGVRDALAKVSRSVLRRVRETGEPVVVGDARADERFREMDSVVGLGLSSLMAVPVRGPGGPLALIVLDNRFEMGVFDERQLPLVRLFAAQAAIVLANAALHAESARRLAELARAKAEVEELNRILAERVEHTRAELHEVKGHVLRERGEAPLKYSYARIVGRSKRMLDLFHLLDKVTDSEVPVLVQGESGTGKELVARALHFNGPRAARPFVSENCAAIPETLLESELFGYVRGAFTGATSDRKGLFEAANGGTLFLDEIGDMPLDMQKKLLRVLQEREVRPVGGKHLVRVDVRILAASNQDLRKACAEGRFREDLYYRLNVITVELPPLRERREDIPLLVEAFLAEIARESGAPAKAVSQDALQALVAHDWPGNVRELRNEVLRAAALSDRVIVPLVLSSHVRGPAAGGPALESLGSVPLKDLVREQAEALERRAIVQALERCRGRKAQAARLLGVSRPTLDAKIQAYGIPVSRE